MKRAERFLAGNDEYLREFARGFGDGEAVEAIALLLIRRWQDEMALAPSRTVRAALLGSDPYPFLRELEEYIWRNGRHMFACLCTPEGIAASIKGMQAAEGSYGQGRI